MKNKIYIGGLIIIIMFIIFFYKKEEPKEVVAQVPDIIEEKKEDNSIIKVDIKGAVKKPGVYEVDSQKRVNDIITIAGGLNKDANTNYINLSAKVTDEMVIWIYTNKEIEKLKLDLSSTDYMIKECNCPVVDNTTCLNNSSINEKININKATKEELMTLDGIGEAKAQDIINYRETNGAFKNIEDIKNVSGIGDSAYTKIKNNITI